jgi:hypothetical protein
MKSLQLSIATVLIFVATLCRACRQISLQSDELGDMDFELAPVDLRRGPHSGRPVYISETQDGILYFRPPCIDEL